MQDLKEVLVKPVGLMTAAVAVLVVVACSPNSELGADKGPSHVSATRVRAMSNDTKNVSRRVGGTPVASGRLPKGIQWVLPEPGSNTCTRPIIRISLNSIPPTMVKEGVITLEGSSLTLDDTDITHKTEAINADHIGEVWYAVEESLSLGRHTTSFSFPGESGKMRMYTWSYTVQKERCPRFNDAELEPTEDIDSAGTPLTTAVPPISTFAP